MREVGRLINVLVIVSLLGSMLPPPSPAHAASTPQPAETSRPALDVQPVEAPLLPSFARDSLLPSPDVQVAGTAPDGKLVSLQLPRTSSSKAANAGSQATDSSADNAVALAMAQASSDLQYSTYLGGSSEDKGYAITVDAAGNAYIAGVTLSADFPAGAGAVHIGPGGGRDVFVVKVNAAGTGLDYAAIIGGSGDECAFGCSIAVDGSGNAYVAGDTASGDFPVTGGAFDTTPNGGRDAFVAKLNAAGTGLVYATYLGGSADECFTDACDVTVDADGNAYLTGATQSADFPFTGGAFDTTYNGGWDAFVVKLNSAGSARAYATFLGGSSDDYGMGIALDGDGNAYVAGTTRSDNFPLVGAFDSTRGGDEAFITKVNAAGAALVYSSYLGGNTYDYGYGVAVDGADSAYVVGITISPDFPTTGGAFQPSPQGAWDTFVSKVLPDGSGFDYSTYLGGINTDLGASIAVDVLGGAHVTGQTLSFNFPTTPGAYDTVHEGDHYDVFVSRLDPSGSVLDYGTFLGAINWDYGTGIAVDPSGRDYVAGFTVSDEFPTTPGAFDETFNGGDYDAFAAKLVTGIDLLPYFLFHISAPSAVWVNGVVFVAEPVNVVKGNYTHQYTDLSIPGLGPATTIQRTYNSADPQDGPFGFGWTQTYAMTVTQESATTVLVKNEDGRLDRFTDAGGGNYTPPPGVFNTLEKNGTFSLTLKDQTVYHFNAAGRLSAIQDKNGNTMTLAYTGSNLTSITDAVGRTTTLTYDGNNRITQITDPAGRTLTYGYDGAGNLASFTDARGKTTTYTYDAQHRLVSITDANGHTFVINTYDDSGRVSQQQDALGNVTTFIYGPGRQTRVIDPLGHQTIYVYDSDGRITTEIDALAKTESYTFDGNNQRIAVTDKNGHTTRYAYDANGNTTVITDSLGFTTTMTYDARNNLTSKTDALGRTTTYTYDANSNLISATDPLGNVTSFTYDARGQLISTTDANGNVTQYGYDANGYQTTITDALGNVTTFNYDIAGRKLSETDANSHTTTYAYDANNNLLTVTDALGGVTTYTYDNVGNRTSVTDALGRTTTYSYDAKDRLVTVTDALGGVTTYGYDAVNNRTVVTDANGHATVYTYDAVDRLKTVTDPLGNTTTYEYDGKGNRTAVIDPNGHKTTFSYDALDRLTRVIDPLGHITRYGYDAVGNKTSVMDANGHTTLYGYDALNRLTSVTDAMGGTVTYAYDGVGNKTSMTDANGHVTTYSYDPLNRLATVTDPVGNTTVYSYDPVGNRIELTDANGQTTTYSYDPLNRLITITRLDETVEYAYNAVGNRTVMTDTTGTTTYVYDNLDRLTQVTDGAGNTVGYAYDAVGNRTRITYPNGDPVDYAYDAANRLISVTDWAGRTTTYTYDPAGNLLTQTNPNGTSTTYTYDDANRLTRLVNNGPSGVISSFDYTMDAVGNRTRVVEADGDVIDYTYDALYRLIEVDEQLRVDFNSDCVVNIIDIQASTAAWGTADPTFDLDGSGQVNADDVMGVSNRWRETCERATYTYDPMGNRLSLITPSGTLTYTYDAADRLLSISDGTTFTWDNNGNQLSKGSTTYTYDTTNQLTQVVNGATTVQFTYDGDGKRTRKTVNGIATSYTYDASAGLPVVLIENTVAGSTRYIYGLDLIAGINPDGSTSYYHFDALGSTRQLSDGSGAVVASYAYDAFGNLVKNETSNAFLYTGEQTDTKTSLVYLRARYYDPKIGRFITKDDSPGFPTFSQTLNRYSYAHNNPVTFNDPDGHIILANFAIGFVAGVAEYTVKNAVTNIASGRPAFADYDLLNAAAYGVKGSVSYGFGPVGGIIASGAVGAFEYARKQDFKNIDPKTLGLEAGKSVLKDLVVGKLALGRLGKIPTSKLLDPSLTRFTLGNLGRAVLFGAKQGFIGDGIPAILRSLLRPPQVIAPTTHTDYLSKPPASFGDLLRDPNSAQVAPLPSSVK